MLVQHVAHGMQYAPHKEQRGDENKRDNKFLFGKCWFLTHLFNWLIIGPQKCSLQPDALIVMYKLFNSLIGFDDRRVERLFYFIAKKTNFIHQIIIIATLNNCSKAYIC